MKEEEEGRWWRKKGGRGEVRGEQVVQSVESYIKSPRLLGRIRRSLLLAFFLFCCFLKAMDYASI